MPTFVRAIEIPVCTDASRDLRRRTQLRLHMANHLPLRALLNFQTAVRRYARSIKLLMHRCHSSLTEVANNETLQRYPNLVTFSDKSRFALTPEFPQAEINAKRDADAKRARQAGTQ